MVSYMKQYVFSLTVKISKLIINKSCDKLMPIRHRFLNIMLILPAVVFMPLLVSDIALSQEPIRPLPLSVKTNKTKVKLGEELFHDKRLSKDNTIACASCHDLEMAGVDRKQFSTGVGGKLGSRNSPTVFNAVFNFRQFWDGRAADLVEQAGGPVVNPDEMAADWPEVIKKLEQDQYYQDMFEKIYGKISPEAIQDAIAEFEKTLITSGSRFDDYLRGNKRAISPREKRGYDLFKAYGCSSCHQGANVGGNMFQKFGVLKDINLRNKAVDDLGRYNVTKNKWDMHVFKVPSLRLAVLTPPYFHDGSVETIEEAVNIMIEFQLGRSVPDEDRDDIIAFLGSLVGEYKGSRL